ncbi:MAG: Cof-type HAD-IIB family hydrolase [Alphaproteobacteria bacterium]|nr:Cof-type HAD-IIB family hydrolase [Alphaproteobacteria bacterium]
MIKAAFFDIDGTLISFKTHEMPKSTQEALERLHQKGVKVFIATGRAPKDVGFLKKYFDFDGVISFNGQYCFDKTDVLHNAPLPHETILSVLPYLKEKQIASTFETIDENIFNLVNDRVHELIRLVGFNEPEKQVADVSRLERDIYQMTTFVIPEEEADLVAHLPGCRTVRWYPTFVNVIGENGGKHVGIAKVCEKYGIGRDEIMAFGDGGNDVDMLEHAGIGVAMGNGGADAKAAANYITTAVDDDGVYNALKHFEII